MLTPDDKNTDNNVHSLQHLYDIHDIILNHNEQPMERNRAVQVTQHNTTQHYTFNWLEVRVCVFQHARRCPVK